MKVAKRPRSSRKTAKRRVARGNNRKSYRTRSATKKQRKRTRRGSSRRLKRKRGGSHCN